MQKILSGVTITGADDSVNINDLEQLTEEYPWVEWGILLSQTKSGQPRYPSEEWLRRLCQAVERNYHGSHIIERPLFISGHLCGRWARNILRGDWEFQKKFPELASNFMRWQLNVSPYYRLFKEVETCFESLPFASNIQIIFQFSNTKVLPWLEEANRRKINVACLWDQSGGRGAISPYPDNLNEISASYVLGIAGGLAPDNLGEQLIKMAGIVSRPIWIDVESGVRTNDVFDLNKVKQFLSIASKWVVT